MLDTFFQTLWQQYTAITPQAQQIRELFSKEGETLVNDHVAFRTFGSSPVDLDHLQSAVLALGYEPFDEYKFEQKKLRARSYVHPNSEAKLFVSELEWQRLPESVHPLIENYISQMTNVPEGPGVLSAGRLWQMPTYTDYQALQSASEYAAWLSVWGLRANHFTLYINHMHVFDSLQKVVAFLQLHGFELNPEGGLIKGTEEDCLIQSSTLADRVPVEFPDAGEQFIASCYYEFAQRFSGKDGKLYQGFVPNNADKIFESTHSR